jgi:hypothetical protein
VLVLGLLILSGCGTIAVQPTQVSLPVPTKLPVAVPLTPVRAITPTVVVEASDAQTARDAALAHVSEHYGEQTPAPGLTWRDEFTPEGPVRLANYQYTVEDWMVSISYRTQPVVYQVVVTNQATGFRWEGTVDASGQVTEQVAPDDVRTIRDTALAYISERYGEQAPALDLTWAEERSTPDIWSGSGTYRYIAGDWAVQVCYPMIPPESVVYLVTVGNRATGFHWEGQVDAAGRVTELLDDVLAARDAALAYVSEHYGRQAPELDLTWTEDYIGVPVPEGPWGAGTLQYTYTAEDWAVYVSYQFLTPKPAVYGVLVQNLATHFYWEGEVDAAGQVTETVAP